jgi:ATP-dependent DNA helicase RecQ
VAEHLRQVEDNGGQVQRATGSNSPQLPPFSMPEELRAQIPIEPSAMIKRFTDSINALVDLNAMRKLKMTALTAWLVEEGYLREDLYNGKRRKAVTDKGRAAGITEEQRQGAGGVYTATLYNEDAQRLLVARLEEIIALSNAPGSAKEEE